VIHLCTVIDNVTVSDIDGRWHLRSARRGLLDVPRVELSTYGRRSFSYANPSAWNALPDYLKNSTLSLSVIRNQLKHFLFSSYYSTPSVFEVITETRYINYLLTYLLTVTKLSEETLPQENCLQGFIPNCVCWSWDIWVLLFFSSNLSFSLPFFLLPLLPRMSRFKLSCKGLGSIANSRVLRARQSTGHKMHLGCI